MKFIYIFCLFEKWEGVLSCWFIEVGGVLVSDGICYLVEVVMGVRKVGCLYVLCVNVYGFV